MELKEKEIYTPDEVRNLLKISQSTFFRLIKKGILRAAKIGGQYRVLGSEIVSLLNPKLQNGIRRVYRKVKGKIKEE